MDSINIPVEKRQYYNENITRNLLFVNEAIHAQYELFVIVNILLKNLTTTHNLGWTQVTIKRMQQLLIT